MKRRILKLCILALTTLSAASVAHADTFDFSFTGVPLFGLSNSFSGSGTFTATEEGSSVVYDVTGVTGTVQNGSGSSAISSLLAVGKFEGNDNILIYPGIFLGSTYLDSNGISFTLANGNDVNLNSLLVWNTATLGGPKGNTTSEFDTFSLSKNSPVPEPNSLALFGTGILGIAGAMRLKLRFG